MPQLPPYLYLIQVLQHCPKAGALYVDLWNHKDKENRLSIGKNKVRSEFLTSLAKFRHDLLLLVKEGIVSVDETPNAIHIELVDWEESKEHLFC